MKAISIAGNIGKDAETRTTPTGDKVTSWTVAVEERAGKEKGTFWFDCTLWGSRGEALAQYLTKGSKVAVSGELTRREYEGKTYLGVNVSGVTLQGGKASDDEPRREAAPRSKPERNGYGSRPMADEMGRASAMDDEIPFIMEWR
jgi:single-strand DNA-binding protein